MIDSCEKAGKSLEIAYPNSPSSESWLMSALRGFCMPWSEGLAPKSLHQPNYAVGKHVLGTRPVASIRCEAVGGLVIAYVTPCRAGIANRGL
jgi:hypothetical protein